MEDNRILKKILAYNPKRHRNLGGPHLDGGTEQSKRGLVHEDDDM
jgi:hypothetical protein